MATKKQITQVMKSAINEAASYPLNMKPPRIIDMYEHALGVKLDEATKAQFDKMFRDGVRMRQERLNSMVGAARNLPQEIAKAIQATQSGDRSTQATSKRKREKHIPYKQAQAILKKLNCPKDRKTLQRWIKGENTPDGFTPETMATLQGFSAWATIYANREQSKINANNALRIDNPDSRKMGAFR